jgi:hypothetical protein
MDPPRPSSSCGSPADLARTRRQFLLAREQAAAHQSTERFASVRDMSRWALARERGGRSAADPGDDPSAVRPRR